MSAEDESQEKNVPQQFKLSNPGLTEVKHAFSLEKYIALGTVRVLLQRPSDLEQELQVSTPKATWQELGRGSSVEDLEPCSVNLVETLLHLVEASWIRVVRPTTWSPSHAWRIFVLPHDFGRGRVDRRDKALQKSMHSVLLRLSTSVIAWNEGVPELEENNKFDVWATGEQNSLFYMFNTVPSPQPTPGAIKNNYMRDCVHRILDEDEDPWGLKTKLYPYQRRAVALMLQRELAPSMQLDPRFEQRQSLIGQTYYYSARDTLFLESPRYYDTVKGGILAETMGLGKTLICIAIVLATRGQFPSIPVPYEEPKKLERPPSLLQTAASASTKAGAPWKTFFEELRDYRGDQHDECIRIMSAQRPSYEIPSRVVRTMRRSSVYGSSETVQLSCGTIVVVPANLVQQWEEELRKHIRENSLSLLVLNEKNAVLPSSEQLLKYDIVLFSRRRFEREISTTEDLYVSPLKYIHWLRMIIDEGQGFSSNSTNAAAVAEKVVRAERRWIVSGTPSRDLLGVEVSLPAMQVSDQGAASSKYLTESLENRRTFDAQQERTSGAAKSLGELASKFLKARPWSLPLEDSEPSAIWDEYIYRHEDFRQRTYSCFSSCFQTTLNHLVVKTRPQDVERDLLLPPLHHNVIRLTPSPVDKMTANLFVLLYTTNAVTSERRDQDYLFHSSSRFHLLRLTSNLRQSAFFWAGFSAESVQASIDVSEQYLLKPGVDCSSDDRQLLMNTVTAARQILHSPIWHALTNTQEMGAYLNQWPSSIAHSWLFHECEDPPAIGFTQIGQVQKYVNQNLASADPIEGLQDVGHAHDIGNIGTQADTSAGPRPELAMAKNGVPTAVLGDNFRPKSKASKVTFKTTVSPSKLRGTGIESNQASASKKVFVARRKMHAESRSIDLDADSELGSIQMIGTASSKLSYLLDRVMDLQGTERILIFYDGSHIAYYISQALDLLNVKHLIYANTLSNDIRSKYIVLFDADDSYRVLIMDIKQAARGLNVSSASRVFFVNPPCQPDIEAQAIKRAHRIGQSRPVHVETLVLAGTIEESIHDRASKMTQREYSSMKTLEDDEDIRSIIQNAKVLPLTDSEVAGQSQMARLAKPQQIFGRPGRKTRKVEGLEKEIFGDIDDDQLPQERKTRRTHGPYERPKQKKRDETLTAPDGHDAQMPMPSLFGGS